MKRLLAILLVLTMVLTPFCAMGTVANAGETSDYTIVLNGGVIYRNSVGENNIISPSDLTGLTYDNTKGEWTMNNFVFTTSAPIGIKIEDEDNVTINVSGTNSITSSIGIPAGSKEDCVGISAVFSMDEEEEEFRGTKLTIKGKTSDDKLQVNSVASPNSAGNTGIRAFSLLVDNVSLDVNAGYEEVGDGGSAIGIDASAVAFNDSITNVSAKDYGSVAIGYISSLDVTGVSSLTAYANGEPINRYADFEGNDPNAIAKDKDTDIILTWSTEKCKYLNPGESSNFTETLTLTAFACEISECTNNTNIEGKQYGSIADALTAAGNNAATIKVKCNVTENVTINENQTITIDLNDHVLKGTGSGSVITNNGMLTVTDSTMTGVAKDGTIRYFTDSKCAHGVTVGETCTNCSDGISAKDGCFETHETGYEPSGKIEGKDYIKVTGGVITGGAGTNLGAGTIEITNLGTYGGAIINKGTLNATGISMIGSSSKYGGGIANIGSTAKANLTDCGLFGNTAETSGGAAYNISGTFTVDGVTISYNTANYGGGVYNDYKGTSVGSFFGKSTIISYNTAKGIGSGVFNKGTCKIVVGGITKITDNIRNTDQGIFKDNLRLYDQNLTIGNGENGCSTPDNDMEIGVTLTGKIGSRSGAFTTNGTVQDAKHFTSDSAYDIVFVKGDKTKEATDTLYSDHLELGMAVAEVDFGTAENPKIAKFKTVQEAINEATANMTVKMLADSAENITVDADDNNTLNLNGHMLKADLSDSQKHSVITNKGTLTIKDTATTNNFHYFKVNSNGLWVLDTTITSGETYTFDSTQGLEKAGISSADIPAENAIIKVTGGCITGGKASYGGGIRNMNNLTISGGIIVGNTATNDGGAVRNSGTFNMSGGKILGCTATNGGAILNDSSATSATIRDNACIAYCNASVNGGAVYNISTFNMSGGKILGCTAKNGGGVFVAQTDTKQGKFTMEAGSIVNCEADNNGGGVVNFSGTEIEYGFEMTGGTISGCKAKYGGGAFANGDKEKASTNYYTNYTKLSGGTIKDNECTSRGGGVYLGPLTETMLSGNIVIKDNKGNPEKYGTVSNLMTLKAVEIKTIGNNASVGVAMLNDADPPAVCSGAFTTNGTNTDSKYFHSDSDDYVVKFVKGDTTKESGDPLYTDHIELVAVHSVTESTCTNGSVSVGTTKKYTEGDEVAISNIPENGYELETYSVFKTVEPTTTVTVTEGKFTMPAYDVTVSATFKKKQLAAFGVNYFSHYVAEQIEEEEIAENIDAVSNIKIRVYSKYVKVNGKRYIKPYIKVLKGEDTIQTLKDAGYTFKYVFYRSTSTKTSTFKKQCTTKNLNFTDKKGTNGKYYYYKAKLMIYDENCELVKSTTLSQCKYGCRLYNENSKNVN